MWYKGKKEKGLIEASPYFEYSWLHDIDGLGHNSISSPRVKVVIKLG